MKPGECCNFCCLAGFMHHATYRTLFNTDDQLCLDAGNITEVCSNAVLLVSCVNTASQRWTAYNDRSVRPDSNTSMCLDVAGNLYTTYQAAIHTWWACMPCCWLHNPCRLPGNLPNLVLMAFPFCMGMHVNVHAGCHAGMLKWRCTAAGSLAPSKTGSVLAPAWTRSPHANLPDGMRAAVHPAGAELADSLCTLLPCLLQRVQCQLVHRKPLPTHPRPLPLPAATCAD